MTPEQVDTWLPVLGEALAMGFAAHFVARWFGAPLRFIFQLIRGQFGT